MLALFLYTIMEMNNLLFDGAVGTTPLTTSYTNHNLKFSALPIIVLLIPSLVHMHTRTHAHTHTLVSVISPLFVLYGAEEQWHESCSWSLS
jgi:hypothetical protein